MLEDGFVEFQIEVVKFLLQVVSIDLVLLKSEVSIVEELQFVLLGNALLLLTVFSGRGRLQLQRVLGAAHLAVSGCFGPLGTCLRTSGLTLSWFGSVVEFFFSLGDEVGLMAFDYLSASVTAVVEALLAFKLLLLV